MKICESVVGLALPYFSGQFTNALLCRQSFNSFWETVNQSYPVYNFSAPPGRQELETRLEGNSTFCESVTTLSNSLAGNCCGSKLEKGGILGTFDFFAPNLPSNFQGFSRVQALLLAQVYLTLIGVALRLFLDIGNAYFVTKFKGGLQRKVLDAFLAQEMGFFDARPTGVLLGRIMNDIPQVQGIAVVFSIIVISCVTISVSAAAAYGYNKSLFVLFLALIPFEFVIIERSGAFSRKWQQIANNRMGKHYQVMQEILDKTKHIKVFNGVSAALMQFSNSLQLQYRISAYMNYVQSFGFGLVQQLYGNVFNFSLMYISARLMIPSYKNVPTASVFPFVGFISFGDYSTFNSYATSVKDNITQLSSLWQSIMMVFVIGQTMCYFIYRKPVGGGEKMQGTGFVTRMEDLDPAIRFDNVSFAYPSRPGLAVLKNFNVTFPAKKFSCIIGNSGGGKSTTMALILRMYEPSSGKIWIGKHEYNTVNLTFLRECFAYVTQEPVMFSCTIRENLLYANPRADEEQIRKALEDAGCVSIITSLPDGLNTKLAGETDAFKFAPRRIECPRNLHRHVSTHLFLPQLCCLDVGIASFCPVLLNRYHATMLCHLSATLQV
jgi:ABC-type multidrug transport system fused ATPase/permease subunit